MKSRRGTVPLGGTKRTAQRRQAPRADECAEEQAVGAQYAADQCQGTRQVGDLVQYARAHHQIERGVGKRQAILVRLHAARSCGKGVSCIAAHDAGARRGDEPSIETAEIENLRELARHRVKAFGDAVEHRRAQEVVLGIAGRGTVTAQAASGTIEDFGCGVF